MLGTLCLSISLLDEPLFLSPLHIIEVGEITSKTVCFSGSEWSTGIRNTHYGLITHLIKGEPYANLNS